LFINHRRLRRAIGKEYLYEELGEGIVDLMKKIRRTPYPHAIMNPGKVGATHFWSLRARAESQRQLDPDDKARIGDVLCTGFDRVVLYLEFYLSAARTYVANPSL
jgi:hypothetical protein